MPGLKARPPQDRFLEKFLIGDGCWEWTASTIRKGYGQFARGNGRPVLAHRYMWELLRGEIPDGLCVLHKCDNPPCVNPDHLFLGTKADNNRDMREKGRNCRGTRNHSAKLTPEAVVDIRKRVADGEMQKDVARRYGVCKATLNQVVSGKTWKVLV